MKLQGEAYLTYWRDRMARGPAEAGHDGNEAMLEAQADAFFAAMTPALADHYAQVVELGCGYGRILWRMRNRATRIHGVDISADALKRNRVAGKFYATLWCIPGSSIPVEVSGVDLAYTCTCLQHITDDQYLHEAADSLVRALKPGGTLLLLENVSHPSAEHVRDMDPQDYRDLFTDIEWHYESFVTWKNQRHVVLVGRKQ